ncbi:MAG: hypothetical protein OXI41_01410 [Chloroflexota bacterium]|nr:hypothetical protein [Chloroflexota bacterium]MDE2896671.1 hypothetical protein [Chloroflexota bacterium]
MPRVWLVRAGGSNVSWLDDFKNAGYIGVGYNLQKNLTGFVPHEEIEIAYREANPDKSHQPTISRIVNQVEAFLFEIEHDDHILTPTRNRRVLMHGIANDSPAYFEAMAIGGLPHRRSVSWVDDGIEFAQQELEDLGIYGYRGTVKLISEVSDSLWER